MLPVSTKRRKADIPFRDIPEQVQYFKITLRWNIPVHGYRTDGHRLAKCETNYDDLLVFKHTGNEIRCNVILTYLLTP
jgi:hypothetical protein